jgi:hypothetical protein
MVLLAGLDHIDSVFTEFVSALEAIIRNSNDCKDSPLYNTVARLTLV